jgi:hypothetical protein
MSQITLNIRRQSTENEIFDPSNYETSNDFIVDHSLQKE